MHHQDFSGESGRKQAFHYRRGSGGGPAPPPSAAAAAAAAGSSGAGTLAEDAQAQAGSASPSLHHQAQATQVKKKSGFQITSVTSAQISGNNSLADDTESYDDMDESHTEDLSSSDMLDVSVSKATDKGVPERSSSDETLNSLHGVDTPGLASPNEPLQQHGIPPHASSLVNGAVHHPLYPPHHRSDSLGGEASAPVPPVQPLATSSPSLVSKRQDNSKTAVLTNQQAAPLVVGAPADVKGGMNVASAALPAAVVPSSTGSETALASSQASTASGGTSSSASVQISQTQPPQTATGSRFRVVKLDTNSEPVRKGRWLCTEYYEKEVSQSTPTDVVKAAEVTADAEAGSAGASAGVSAVQPPHTLQPYQPPSQDFTSPQAILAPLQGLAQAAPLSYVSPQDAVGAALNQKPAVAAVTPKTDVSQTPPSIPHQLPYAVDIQPAPPQGSFPTLHAVGAIRQPDFIQPTAPFQTQVQPPLPHVPPGIPVTPSPQLQVQPPPAVFPASQPQILPAPAAPAAPVVSAPLGTPYMPLTALQADLQPLLTAGVNLAHVPAGGSPIKSSQLEDAQRLLLQHQSLLGLPGLPRLGVSGAEGVSGMSAEASAFMMAAGLRSQPAEGEEDSSSGTSVVAIDNKIEQAMDLVKSHLMYAVREEVEVLKEQIKELIERNTQLEQENNLLKTLASPEQMAQFQAQVQTGGSPTAAVQPPVPAVGAPPPAAIPSTQSSSTSA